MESEQKGACLELSWRRGECKLARERWQREGGTGEVRQLRGPRLRIHSRAVSCQEEPGRCAAPSSSELGSQASVCHCLAPIMHQSCGRPGDTKKTETGAAREEQACSYAGI